MRPTIRWSTMPLGFALAAVFGALSIVLFLPQLAAIAVTAPSVFSRVEDRLSFVDVFRLWLQPDPALVTGAQDFGILPARVVHWAVALTVIMVMGALVTVFFVVRGMLQKDPQRKPGLAPLNKVEEMLGTKQLVKRGPALRPGLDPVRLKPQDCGYPVGYFWNSLMWLRIEDPTIVIGPSRSGKGFYLVLNWILSAPGAVITTSSKLDNALLTMKERMRLGSRVLIFAPGVEGGDSLGHVLKWDPVDGCVDEATLVRRIRALIPSDSFSGSTSNGGHWDTLGQQLASHLFHAAACAGVGVDTIWEWVGSPQRAQDAVRAIREHPQGLKEHARHLETVINMPPEQRASQWGVLPTVLAFLESRSARAWMTPSAEERVDLVDFILDAGTMYFVGDKQTTGGYVRIIDGVLAEVDYITKGLADASPRSRLDPPVSYILDEAGNFEYQGLYELITAGGGRGRVAIAVFQSKEQLSQWGQENAKTMWDAAVAKIILPGGSDEDELTKLSKLIGEMWVTRESHSWGSGIGDGSVQVSEEKRSIMTLEEIRELEGGYGVFFYRNLKPVIPKFIPFTENPAYGRCSADMQELALVMQQKSPFADRLLSRREQSDA